MQLSKILLFLLLNIIQWQLIISVENYLYLSSKRSVHHNSQFDSFSNSLHRHNTMQSFADFIEKCETEKYQSLSQQQKIEYCLKQEKAQQCIEAYNHTKIIIYNK